MKNNKNSQEAQVSKDYFIKFLASATPEEINQYIAEKGKPGKLIDPMVMFDKKKETENKNTAE